MFSIRVAVDIVVSEGLGVSVDVASSVDVENILFKIIYM